MRKVAYFSITATALALFILIPATVSAASVLDINSEIIPSGEVINDNLTFFSDSVISEDAVVNGDVSTFSGHLIVDGTINGDLTVFGGTVEINGTLDGDTIIMGGYLEYGEGAAVTGECVVFGSIKAKNGLGEVCNDHLEFNPEEMMDMLLLNVPSPFSPGATPDSDGVPAPPSPPELNFNDPFPTILGSLFSALFLGFIAYVIASAMPSRLYNVRDAVVHRTVASGGVGFLTAIASSSFFLLTSPIWFILFLALTIFFGLGLVLAGVAAIFVIGICLLGWTAIGSALGHQLSTNQKRRLHHNEPLLTAIGTGILSIALTILGNMSPFLSWMAIVGMFSVGLGGVVLTRIGKQAYPTPQITVDHDKVVKVMDTLPRD